MANGLNKILFLCHVNLPKDCHIILHFKKKFFAHFNEKKKENKNKTKKVKNNIRMFGLSLSKKQYVWAEIYKYHRDLGWDFLHKSINSRFYTDYRPQRNGRKQKPKNKLEPGIFIWGQIVILIYLSRQLSHVYIYTHTFFYYIYTYIDTFLFDKLYIYAHPTQKKKKFSIKIMFDGDL